jgi:glucose-1-phosphate thymidylyltransferase
VKGIILAGGTGSHLWPIPQVVSKHLLPVHDKPMIAGRHSRDADHHDAPRRAAVQGAARRRERVGDRIALCGQPRSDGLAQAFLIGRDFIAGERSALVLGDNIFYGQGFIAMLQQATESKAGAVVFGNWVRDSNQG